MFPSTTSASSRTCVHVPIQVHTHGARAHVVCRCATCMRVCVRACMCESTSAEVHADSRGGARQCFQHKVRVQYCYTPTIHGTHESVWSCMHTRVRACVHAWKATSAFMQLPRALSIAITGIKQEQKMHCGSINHPSLCCLQREISQPVYGVTKMTMNMFTGTRAAVVRHRWKTVAHGINRLLSNDVHSS